MLTRRDKIVLGLMVGIPTFVQILFVWLPALMSIGLSFTRWDGIYLNQIKWVGAQNYQYVFENYPPFWPAVEHNIIWLLVLSVVATPIGVLLAVLLDRPIRGTRFYQSVFFMPVMMSMALIGVVFQLVYQRDNGLLNNLLATVGLPHTIDWFGDSSWNLWAALLAATWRHAGYVMLLYLAGLKGIDPTLHEAAAIDGATPRQTFFNVILPAMRPTNTIVIVITIIESLRAFDIVYVINRGTNGLELISALVVQNLIGEGQVIGVGSAIAVVLLLISLGPISYYLVRTFRKDAQ